MPWRPSYKDRVYTTSVVGYEDIKHISANEDGHKDFSPIIKQSLELGGYEHDRSMSGINGGHMLTTGFAHNAVLSNADKIISAIKSGKISHIFLVGGCDGANPGRNYYTEFVKSTPMDSLVLTLACGKYRFNDLDLGEIDGLPRIIDMGQCNDAYSAIKVAVALSEAFGCGVNELPLSMVLSWYEQWLKRDHSLGYVPHWFFADWAVGFQSGEPVREKDGNSAFQDLVYILTLESAAEMERAFGIPSIADHYTQIASAIRGTIREKYWDATRGLFADTYDHRSFSQHVNSLAILAGIVTGEEATRVMERTLNDSSLIQATIYFRYYVHQALKVAGMGDHLLDNLQIWRDQMALGLTTWAEMPEPTRSDCHAWGASPNIEFFRILLGIDSNAPGFKSIRIAPSLGDLKEVSGTMPHPVGSVTASYKLDKKGKLTARLILPTGTDGVFVWKGKEYQLKSGEQVLTVE